MARLGHLATLLLSIRAASAQSSGSATIPSSTISQASSTTQEAANGFTTAVIPIYLYNAATSLLTEYFPSSTPTNLLEVQWPSTVVLGTATYNLDPGTTATTATSSQSQKDAAPTEPTRVAAKKPSDDSHAISQKKVAIIIGVVIGTIALLVMAVVFWCLHRRRKQTGSFFMRRSSASTISSGGSSRRRYSARGPATYGPHSYVSGGLGPWEEKGPETSAEPHRQPPAATHPALMRRQSSRSTFEDRPFVTPAGSYHELENQRTQTAGPNTNGATQRRSSSSVRDGRPPTPFNPMAMMQTAGPSSQPPQSSQRPELQVQAPTPDRNPFSSPEDREEDDVVSPIMPSRSPDRRHSPMVHYPSWDEVSEFDFASARKQRSYESESSDGWHPGHPAGRGGTWGRHELA